MKLRWKYFLVLLVASLTPMLAVTFISQNASKKLAGTLSAQTQAELMETVRREIVSATENYALITRRSKSSMEFALAALVRETGIVQGLPKPDPGQVYLAADFDNPDRSPEDLVSSELHSKILADGRLAPKPVSYRHPNFLLAPGVRRSAVSDEIARLTRLTPALAGIFEEMAEAILWIYASTESGVHISYPGHGGYPPGYDPRQRPWYLRAKRKMKITWGPPIVDATTGQLTFTVSAPFFDAAGAMAGVAAIDVLIPKVLLKTLISTQWSQQMKSFMVGYSDPDEGGERELWILSQDEQEFSAGYRGATPKSGLYFDVRREEFSKLLPLFESQTSGSFQRPYQGEDAFWSFASIFPKLHFVIIAPKQIVMQLPETVGESFSRYTHGQTMITIGAVITVVLLVSGLALYFSRTNTRDLAAIAHGFQRLGDGDLSTRLDLHFNDERDLIVTSFNQIAPRVKEYLRMSRTLGLAKDVQRRLLPRRDPELEGFDIAGTSLYCEETGGDYYDFIPMGADRMAVVVGDVSGHGVSAALLMATARALVMQRTALPGATAGIMNDVNRRLSMDTADTGNFMTFFYCEIKAGAREVRWVRAGHDPALLYDPRRDRFDELKGRGMALGLDDGFEYEEYRRSLQPDQIILIGTDGIWEMRSNSGVMFGKQRLKAKIREHREATARELITAITDALNDFRGQTPPEDDVTMVVIKAAVA
jgi:sigma-B regulation protein RsbU (phosphoserine phosphatase)